MSEECNGLVLLHENMFKNIDRQLSDLLDLEKTRNGRWDEHLKTSVNYRLKVDLLEGKINEINQVRYWLMGTVATIITAVIIWSVQWGSMTRQIEINTGRLDKLEAQKWSASMLNNQIVQDRQALQNLQK